MTEWPIEVGGMTDGRNNLSTRSRVQQTFDKYHCCLKQHFEEGRYDRYSNSDDGKNDRCPKRAGQLLRAHHAHSPFSLQQHTSTHTHISKSTALKLFRQINRIYFYHTVTTASTLQNQVLTRYGSAYPYSYRFAKHDHVYIPYCKHN